MLFTFGISPLEAFGTVNVRLIKGTIDAHLSNRLMSVVLSLTVDRGGGHVEGKVWRGEGGLWETRFCSFLA